MEKILLGLGLSFTAAKVIPYVIFATLGVVLAYWAFRKQFKPVLKWTLVILLAVVPFLVYFAINPIYSGDFSNNASKIKLRNAYTTDMKDGLLVMAIPGCPYCLESTDALKEMKKVNPEMNITFMVFGDSLNAAVYKDVAEGKFDVVSCDNSALFLTSIPASFPTFIKVDNGTAGKYWSNNDFGVGAKDELVGSF